MGISSEFGSAMIVAVLATALAFYIVSLGWRIHQNVATARRYRQRLLAQLHDLPLDNMLQALNIDTQRFIHQQTLPELSRQMHHCEQCLHASSCDENLRHARLNIEDIGYCPNAPALRKLVST